MNCPAIAIHNKAIMGVNANDYIYQASTRPPLRVNHYTWTHLGLEATLYILGSMVFFCTNFECNDAAWETVLQ